jgi:hypothetical protein
VVFVNAAVSDALAMTPRSALLLLALLLAVPTACVSLRPPGDTYAYRLTPWPGAGDAPSTAGGAWIVTRFEGGVLRIDLKPRRGARVLRPPGAGPRQ